MSLASSTPTTKSWGLAVAGAGGVEVRREEEEHREAAEEERLQREVDVHQAHVGARRER
jgi:hypothetical protein